MLRYISASIALVAAVSVGARADIVIQDSTTFAETDSGFDLYSGTKSFIVYTHDDGANPAPGAPGELTYVYTITNDAGSITSLTRFSIEAPINSITSATFIDDVGNPTPTSVTDNNDGIVFWDWTGSDLIDPGDVSDRLVLISSFTPGTLSDTMTGYSDNAAFDAQGECVGPFNAPVTVGEALPCTIGFWKNRSEGKKGLLKFFPDPDFDTLVSAALALSGGTWATESALLSDLQSKGNRPTSQRARQQFAAFLLNLAAGDLFSDNLKCKLFEGNAISANQCGTAISVQDAYDQILADLAAGNFGTAKDCADDTNNGIGVE